MDDAVTLPDGRVNCRVRIEGTYQGKPWVYVDPPGERSQYIWPPDEGGNIDPSEYWWSEGNMSCDCNRQNYLPDEMCPKEDMPCGNTIRIDRIIPLHDANLTLDLLESSRVEA